MNQETKQLFVAYLDELFPDAKCELIYHKDYELLIATVLSAQCTDKRVNKVTEKLFSLYDLKHLALADQKEIEQIIYPVGTFTKKARFIKEIAKCLIRDFNGHVPNDRKYLMTLPGVGKKTINVVLGNLFGEPGFAVDTHVERVSKRLKIALLKDNVDIVERKLNNLFLPDQWVRLHHQMVLFGRYQCMARNPNCRNCKMASYCRIGNTFEDK